MARRLSIPPISGRSLGIGTLLFAGVLAVFLIARSGRQGNLRPAEGGVLVESSAGPVERVNPLLARTPAERDLAALVFAGLTRPGPGGEVLPDLAESWEIEDDGRAVTFRLRRDLAWHDGEPLTLDDVLFTIDLIRAGHTTDTRLTDVWRTATVTRLSERSVRVELPAPFAPLPAYADFGLLPQHLLRDVDPEQLGAAPFNLRPVGSGAFRLLSLDDRRARLARNDRYHLGAPYLDGIELRFDGSSSADAAVLSTPGAQGDRVVYPLAENTYAMVVLNNDASLFATDTVRRALSLAVDRRGLVAQTLGGRGAPTDVPFAPGSWAHDGQETLPPEIDLAKALLASAGWAPGPDGVLRRGNRDLRFTLVTADEPAWTGVARVLAESWTAIGARVTVAPAQEQALLDEFLATRQYEAALIGWDPGADPDPYSAWHSSLRGQSGGNPANFADEQSDALLVAGRMLGGWAERQEQYFAFQQRFRELSPSIVLYAEAVRYAVRDRFHLSLPASGPSPEARFTDVARWFVNTRSGP